MEPEKGIRHGDANDSILPSTTSRCGEATDDPEDDTGPRSVDSGYFSRDDIVTEPATEVSPQERIIVTQDVISRGSKSFSGKGFFQKSKQPELLLFRDAHIPDEFYSRFQDLVQLYDRPLKSKLKPRFMSWKVKVFGEDENSKRPYIVILCDADSTKKITKFFSKKEIKQQCEGTEGLPSLPVLVINSAPVRLSSEVADVFGREDVYLSNTNCGESIKIVHGGKAKMATLGGIVRVTINGEVRLYGMTAGHIFEEDTADDDGFIGDLLDESEDDAESEDELCSETDSVSTSMSSLAIHVPTEAGGCNFGWIKVGQVMKPMASPQSPENCNLDWGLVELVDQDRRKMNFVKKSVALVVQNDETDTQPKGIDAIYLRENGVVTGQEVLYQPGTEPGYLKGRINTQPAYMHQSPSNKMARVYNMTWNSDWDQVTAGDCGSWVVDHNAHALYGHIVAVDVFDEAYVVPFEDTIEQIAKYLGAEAVGLPSVEDFPANTTAKQPNPQYSSMTSSASQETTSTLGSDCYSSEAGLTGGRLPSAELGLVEESLLYKSDYVHQGDSATCEPCCRSNLISQNPREQANPVVHYGTIASGNQVIKDALFLPYELKGLALLHGLDFDIYHANIEKLKAWRGSQIFANTALPGPRDYMKLTRFKLEMPTAVVSEVTMDKFQQNQTEVPLPKVIADTKERTQPADTKISTTKKTKEHKEPSPEFSIIQEQGSSAATRLKEWSLAARKKHPAETIDALLNKQFDLEDQLNDARFMQQFIRREIQVLNKSRSMALSDIEKVLMERMELLDHLDMLQKRLRTIRTELSHARAKSHAFSLPILSLQKTRYSVPIL